MIRLRSIKAALLSAVFVFLAANSVAANDCVVARSRSFESFRCDEDRLWVVETRRPLQPLYHAVGALSFRQLASGANEFALFVNGSYHDGDYANARLEGLFVVNGKSYAPLKPLDPQLSHVMSLSDTGRITSISLADGDANSSERWKLGTHIQSGPLIIDAGRVATNYIDASINGKDRYKRTAIGMTADGATVIVISRTPRSLQALAAAVLNINRLRDRGLTLLNFDGGPSTSLHATEQRKLSYQADKLTPVLFAIRR
jgi:uncharacterized protein YigE (DUF2233 family)